MGATLARLADRSLPSQRTDLYFHEHALWTASTKLLVCPTAVGCVIRDYDPHDVAGGKPMYTVAKTFSYSDFVPRYEITAVGIPGISSVGVLDKEESHLRTKLGEFIRVQLWKVRHNSLKFSKHGRATPSETHTFHLVIAQQAKIDTGHNEYGDILIHSGTERWRETFSAEIPGFQASMAEDERFASPEAMDRVNIYWKNTRLGTAKKQGFAGAFGGREYGRPYIGLELAPTLESTKKVGHHSNISLKSHALINDAIGHLLSPDRLRALMLCLAWSEQTIDLVQDATPSFIQAMRVHPTAPDSAKNKHMPAGWSTADVARHLQVESTAWVHLHKWEERHSAETQQYSKETTAAGASAHEGHEEAEEVKGPQVDPNDALFV